MVLWQLPECWDLAPLLSVSLYPIPVTVCLSRGKLLVSVFPFLLGSITPGLGRVPESGEIAGIPITTGSVLFMAGHTHLPASLEASFITCLANSLAQAS